VWFRTTTADDDAALMIKVGKGEARAAERLVAVMQDIAASVGKRVRDAAPVIVKAMAATDDEMTALLASGTHYWSLSHGEGWDLPATQAGALGLEVIAPDHSAYGTWLDGDVAWLIRSGVVAVPPGVRDIYRGLTWWQPDEEHACEVLAQALRGSAERRGPALRQRLIRDYAWDKVAAGLLTVLKDAGACP